MGRGYRPKKASKKYWEKKLQEYGLGMDRGKNPRHLSYVGSGDILEKIDGDRRTETGRVLPKKKVD